MKTTGTGCLSGDLGVGWHALRADGASGSACWWSCPNQARPESAVNRRSRQRRRAAIAPRPAHGLVRPAVRSVCPTGLSTAPCRSFHAEIVQRLQKERVLQDAVYPDIAAPCAAGCRDRVGACVPVTGSTVGRPSAAVAVRQMSRDAGRRLVLIKDGRARHPPQRGDRRAHACAASAWPIRCCPAS